MIVTKNSPYTKEEIEQLKEQFDIYIKTVIDLTKGICSAGGDRHSDCEKILLEEGSEQTHLWGGGIDLETKTIDCNSMINIKIQDPTIREQFEILTKNFFKEIL